MVCASLFLYGKWGVTALIGASARGHTAIVQLLLEAGADKDAKDEVRERKERITHRDTHVVDKLVWRGSTV
jgi:hypothetical protein